MTDVLLLYAFTRLDAIHALFIAAMIVSGLCGSYVVFIARIDGFTLAQPVDSRMSRFARRLFAAGIAAAVCVALLPSQRDLAIIVGGKVAIDAARSPEAQEVGGLVLDAIKRQLQESGKP